MVDRNGLQTTLGLMLAAGTSLVLWAALLQGLRWAAHTLF